MISEVLKHNIQEWVYPILKTLDAELYDIEWVSENGKNILRILIDHNKGVSLNLCSQVSQQLSLILDVQDPIPQKYALEVSSPGIFRVLKKEEHFIRFTGQQIKVISKLEGQKKTIHIGLLEQNETNKIVLKSEGSSIEILKDNIQLVHLFPFA